MVEVEEVDRGDIESAGSQCKQTAVSFKDLELIKDQQAQPTPQRAPYHSLSSIETPSQPIGQATSPSFLTNIIRTLTTQHYGEDFNYCMNVLARPWLLFVIPITCFAMFLGVFIAYLSRGYMTSYTFASLFLPLWLIPWWPIWLMNYAFTWILLTFIWTSGRERENERVRQQQRPGIRGSLWWSLLSEDMLDEAEIMLYLPCAILLKDYND